jgi:hypothetical protein
MSLGHREQSLSSPERVVIETSHNLTFMIVPHKRVFPAENVSFRRGYEAATYFRIMVYM